MEIIKAQDFDLVLLDIMMPEMSGYEVLKHLKADTKLRHIPVIIISVLEEIDSVVKCIEIGAEDYLIKPFNPVILNARIGACLEKKRLLDQQEVHMQDLETLNETLAKRVLERTAKIMDYNQILEQQLQEMEAMSDVSLAINSVMDVNLVLEMIMDKSKDVMNAEASSLLMLDKDTGKLRFHVAKGTAGKALESATVNIGQGMRAGWPRGGNRS